jgi:hypothetical protein
MTLPQSKLTNNGFQNYELPYLGVIINLVLIAVKKYQCKCDFVKFTVNTDIDPYEISPAAWY